jgi:hypothetical protein
VSSLSSEVSDAQIQMMEDEVSAKALAAEMEGLVVIIAEGALTG